MLRWPPNVLVYSRDSNFRDKQQRAEQWLRALYANRRGRLSVQVRELLDVLANRNVLESIGTQADGAPQKLEGCRPPRGRRGRGPLARIRALHHPLV